MKGAEALAQWCLDECKSAQGLHSLKAGLAAHDKALEITRIPNLLFNGDVTAMVDFFRTNHLASIEMTKQAALFTIDISQQYLHMLETSLNGMSGSYAPNVQQPSKVVIDYLAQIYGELGNTASDINAAWQKHQLGLLNDTIQSGLDQGGGILAPGHGGSTRSSGRSSTGSSRSNCTACTGPGCACR